MSALLVGLAYRVYHGELHNDRSDSRVVAAVSAAMVGVAKEIHDPVVSRRDLVADGAGIAIGLALFSY